MISDRASAATSGAWPVLAERARAKVNLTLKILGRRADGYHELDSLVAFADVADVLRLDPAGPTGLTVSGPFADALDGHDNLALRALELAAQADPSLRLGALHLDKNLPVAAGIGGGSADAAAALRLVRALNSERTEAIDWMALAARLGADVPVCFADKMSVMTGIGDRLQAVPPLSAPLPALLVNPMVEVPANKTAAVFKVLTAPPVQSQKIAGPVRWPNERQALIGALAVAKNDLQNPATTVLPIVATVLAALEHLPAVLLSRLSGAGPTCFALFDTGAEAELACAILSGLHPEWWIVATNLS